MKGRTLPVFLTLSALVTGMAGQASCQERSLESGERVERSEFVLVALVDSIRVVDEDFDLENEVIIKTYSATCSVLAIYKGTVRSKEIDVEYTRKIGARGRFDQVTIRRGVEYAFFLLGQGKPGVFRIFSPYWGASRAFSDTAGELTRAVKATAGKGKRPGVEPIRSVAPVEPVRPPAEQREPPVVNHPPDKIEDRSTPATPREVPQNERAITSDGLRATLGGPAMAFEEGGQVRLWLVLKNTSGEPKSVYCGDLRPYLRVELRPEKGAPSVRIVLSEAVSPPDPALISVLNPDDSLYVPIDLDSLFDLSRGVHRVQATIELPPDLALPALGIRPWTGMLRTALVRITLGEKAGEEGRGGDSAFILPGTCAEVHQAGFGLGRCSRCEGATTSRERALCERCAHAMGVCPFCLKKRK